MNDIARTPTPRLTGLWFKIGCLSFGGPAAQIALLQDELVDRRDLIDQRSFLGALNFCMLMPGPEAQQLATWAGYRLEGLRGAITAGGLFILPGALVMLALSWAAAAFGDSSEAAKAIFSGLLIVVVALVIHALWRIGSRTVKTPLSLVIAGLSFAALMAGVNYIWIVAGAIAAGLAAARFGWPMSSHAQAPSPPGSEPVTSGGLRRLALLTSAFVVLGAAPVAGALSHSVQNPLRMSRHCSPRPRS
jgi:chromate transporter